jgi:hypothetical protein
MFSMQNHPEIQLILLILNADDDSENIKSFLYSHKQLNWEKFSSYSIKHGVAALIYKKLCSPDLLPLLPDAILSLFKQQYYKTFARNTIFIENFKLIADQAHKNNIDLILLKGISLINNIYEDIGMRPMSDIDVLVKNNDVQQITNILESLNYGTNPIVKSKLFDSNFSIEHFHLPAYINKTNHVMVELHTHIHPEKSSLNIDISEFWKNKIPVKTFNTNVGMLSPENLLQHLYIHIHEHFHIKNIRLSHFYDVAKVIEKYDNNGLDWKKFVDDTLKFNIKIAVFPYLYLTQKYFNVNIPSVVSFHFSDLDKATIEGKFIDILNIHSFNSKELAEMKKEEINNIKGFKNKLIYITGDLFPSKRFMISRYNLKNKQLFFLYYFKRCLAAISRLFFIIFSGKK